MYWMQWASPRISLLGLSLPGLPLTFHFPIVPWQLPSSCQWLLEAWEAWHSSGHANIPASPERCHLSHVFLLRWSEFTVWHSEKELHKSNFPRYYFWNVSESLPAFWSACIANEGFQCTIQQESFKILLRWRIKNLLFHFYVHPEGLETTRWKNQTRIH